MLTRSTFKRPEYKRAPPSKPAMCRPGVRLFVVSSTPSTVPKETPPVRSKAYLRLVAAFPCKHCGVHGYSQAAHPPPTAKGKKECDLQTFPLCCTRPGISGCHVEFDQYRLIPVDQMDATAARWAAETRAEILATGQWPRRIPVPTHQ
jgi:hypothetical protein